MLKNRALGLKNAFAKITETGRYSPEKKAEIAQALKEWRAKQTERILNPNEEQTFLASLAEKIAGTEVTKQEAHSIFEAMSEADKVFERSFNRENESWLNAKDKVDYGSKRRAVDRIMQSIKGNNEPIRKMLGNRWEQYKSMRQTNKLVAAKDLLLDTLRTTRDLSVAIIASIDNSFQFRQGFLVLLKSPKIWKEGFKQSWKDLAETLKGNGEQVQDAVWADVYSNPNYIAGRYHKAGVLVKSEEAFPTVIPEKFPVVGRAFMAAENAFVGSAMRMRLGLFDMFLDAQKKAGFDINDARVLRDTGRIEIGRASCRERV